MFSKNIKLCLMWCCLSALAFPNNAFALEWRELKGEHFIIKYTPEVGRPWAREILREAEYYYDAIGRQLGFTRYQNFWTWDERVKVVIYPDQQTFLKETGLPDWSKGGATNYHWQLKSRAIVSYKQQGGFLNSVLPHEISHLILIDFVGDPKKIPLWFNEGVAQLQEEGKRQKADAFMREAVRQRKFIPFRQLVSSDVRVRLSEIYVTFFYVQSLSVVDFLIREYGSQRFGQLCRELKAGYSFEKAIQRAYTSIIDSLDDLEKKWLYSLRN